MDPSAVAGVATAAVVEYLAHKSARLADRLVDRQIERVYDAVSRRLARERGARRELDALGANPGDVRQQGRLEHTLEAVLERDRRFASQLADLLERLPRQETQPRIQVSDAGPVAFGGDVILRGRNVAGRDLNSD